MQKVIPYCFSTFLLALHSALARAHHEVGSAVTGESAVLAIVLVVLATGYLLMRR